MSKKERLKKANKLILTVSEVGRKFFRYEGFVGRFELGKQGHIFWIDKYTKKRIYTHTRGSWKGFSDGGTLHSFIKQLRDYIRCDRKVWRATFSDHWGYGEDMEKVRQKAVELEILESEVTNA